MAQMHAHVSLLAIEEEETVNPVGSVGSSDAGPCPRVGSSDAFINADPGDRFTFEDTGKTDWAEGRGYKHLPPMHHGDTCTTLTKVKCALLDGGPLSPNFRHCGFAVPCDEHDFCDETKGKAIQSGINIINGQGGIEWLPVRTSAR